ncbi:MAG: jacalin-like lectin [Bacteroidota bacterium]
MDDAPRPTDSQSADFDAELAGLTESLGDGYDSVSGRIRSSVVSGETVQGGTEAEVYIRVTESVSELADALRITQSLSVSYLKIASVDQKMEFVRNLKVTNQSVSVVVYARKQLSSDTLRSPALTESPGSDVERFVRAHGDAYVAGISRGGEYYAVYTFQSETREQQQSVTASLKANGVYSGVTVGTSLETAIENTTKDTNTTWTFSQQVSGVSSPSLPDRKDLIAYALAFPDQNLDRPTNIGIETEGYERVPGFDLDFQRIIDNRRYFVGGGVEDGLTDGLVRVESLRKRVEGLRDIYRVYGYSGDAGLDAFGDLLEADFRAIREQFVAYADDPLRSFARPPLPSLDKGNPVLTYEKGVSAKWGRDGGDEFGYGSIEEAVLSQRRLAWVQLRGGKYVDRLSLRYDDVHGEGKVQHHGRDGGRDAFALSLDRGEVVTEVSLRHGRVIDRLALVTNEGARTEVGRDGGDPAEWKADGRVVLGFQGRAGRLLDALQVVWIKLQPAAFETNG